MNQNNQIRNSHDANLIKKKSLKKEFIYDKVDNYKRAELLRLVSINKKKLLLTLLATRREKNT